MFWFSDGYWMKNWYSCGIISFYTRTVLSRHKRPVMIAKCFCRLATIQCSSSYLQYMPKDMGIIWTWNVLNCDIFILVFSSKTWFIFMKNISKLALSEYAESRMNDQLLIRVTLYVAYKKISFEAYRFNEASTRNVAFIISWLTLSHLPSWTDVGCSGL